MLSVRQLLPALVPRSLRKGLYGFLAGVLPAQFGTDQRMDRLVRKLTRMTVCKGPFKGMKYIGIAVGSTYLPKLLGTYEMELHPVVEEIVAGGFDVLANVGAAEGYYAVGMARRCPGMRVLAYERDPQGQEAFAQLAQANDISHIAMLGNCEPGDLQRAIEGARRALVVCDIEGGELEMLDPGSVPALRNAHILVELHEFILKGISETICGRFESTHRIEHIWERPRTIADFPLKSAYLALMPNYALLDSMREWRPERMSWFWMTPLNSSAG